MSKKNNITEDKELTIEDRLHDTHVEVYIDRWENKDGEKFYVMSPKDINFYPVMIENTGEDNREETEKFLSQLSDVFATNTTSGHKIEKELFFGHKRKRTSYRMKVTKLVQILSQNNPATKDIF